MSAAAPARRKLPAFARTLMDNRRRGFHPLTIELLYGDEWGAAYERAKLGRAAYARFGATLEPYGLAWRRGIGLPMIALRPRDYAPGMIDFRCVAGCEVDVLDEAGGVGDWDADAQGAVTRWGIFYDLIAELSEWAATVWLVFDGRRIAAPGYAFDHRMFDASTRSWRWPRWWSDELQAKHDKRDAAWFSAASRRVESELTESA